MENKTKTIYCEMSLTKKLKGEEHTSKYVASIELSARTSMSEIADFIDGMRKIWTKAVNARRESDEPSFSMEITEHILDKADDWKTIEFNRWYTYDICDICTEKGEEGIYLRPDTKYTEERRDMSIGKDILRDLAFTMG